MKKTILTAFLVGFATLGYSQGVISLDNFANTSTNPSATAGGLFWLSTGGTPALINQDFNAAFYVGANSNSLALLNTFLLSNGTAAYGNPLPGIFLDPTGQFYYIPGAFESAFVQIQAWTGNFNSDGAAVSGEAFTAESPVFINPLGLPPGPPTHLTGMPAMVLAVPEPLTFALGGLGCLLLLLWRWRGRRNTNEKANP